MGDIVTTRWTPELIPAELPPNVEQELVEPHYKKNGEVIRTTANRRHEAVCLHPHCPLAFAGPTAFPEATAHTANTGHLTRLYYVAEYTMSPNPLHPKMAGRIMTELVPDTQDIPASAQPVLGNLPAGRPPRTSRRRDKKIQAHLREQEMDLELQEAIEAAQRLD